MANARTRFRPPARLSADAVGGRPRRAAGICVTVIASLLVGLTLPAGALPPPPENPSDDQISASQSQAAQINDMVGKLSAKVANTQGEIDRLNNDMALKAELSQKAAVDLDVAVSDAADADSAATAAGAAATASQEEIDRAQAQVDSFVAASFRQGSTLGSMTALWDAGSADELLQRTQLLESISGSQLDVIGNLQRARVAKANLDAAARAALQVARDKQAEADVAKQNADRAAAEAATALQVGQARLRQLESDLSAERTSYQAAVNTVNNLQGQRQAYTDWLVLKAAEEERLRKEAEEAARKAAEEEAARQAAAAAAAAAEAARIAAEQQAQRQAAAAAAAAAATAQRQAARDAQAASAAAARTAAAAASRAAAAPSRAAGSARAATPAPVQAPAPAAYNGDIGQRVVAAARSWLGTRYSWGGGNASGPTVGIRDGGTADSFGDYMNVGFDCSGLTLYAFAQVGVSLPHYSGYQFYKGARIARSDLQAGDLVFYANDTSDPATIHHVAIYMGGNQMLESPQSGSYVKISPMRWDGYIGAARPYA